MSVAFRRDSDEEHLEPKFELPIPAGPNLVTPRGLRLIGERKVELERQLQSADEEAVVASLQRDLRYWNTRQVTAQLAAPPSGDEVEIGVRVAIRLDGKTRTWIVVGQDEAEPALGLIAYDAPLSRALLGARVGDLVSFGGRTDAIEVLEIEVPADHL